jgi:hypothetical protein
MADLNLTDQERAILLSGGTLPDERLDEIAGMSEGMTAPISAAPSETFDLLQVAKELEANRLKSDERAMPEASTWDYIKAGASGVGTGIKYAWRTPRPGCRSP